MDKNMASLVNAGTGALLRTLHTEGKRDEPDGYTIQRLVEALGVSIARDMDMMASGREPSN